MTKKIAYVRTSRNDEYIENQIEYIRKIAPDTIFFVDAGVSGSVSSEMRPGYQEMIEYIEREKPDELYVYEISRLGRMMYDVLETVKDLEEKGVRVISVSPKESWMNTSDETVRKLILAIFSWVAEREREMISQRTREGISRARSEGKKIGRPEKKIPWKKVDDMRTPDQYGRRVPYTVISRILDIPYSTLLQKKNERDKTCIEVPKTIDTDTS